MKGSPFKIYSRTNTLRNKIDVFVACNSYEDALNAATNHGKGWSDGYYNTPILDPIHKTKNPNEFPHFHLGRDNRRELVMHEGIAYNYHYYFGDNSHGRIARQEKGCDQPNPYYF